MGWNPFKKSRKYPIKRNEFGESARQQAFTLFLNGFRPAQIFKDKMVPVKKTTLFRYHSDWKKEQQVPSYSVIRKLRKSHPEIADDTIKMLAEVLNISEGEAISYWNKPWGVKQLLSGEWPRADRAEIQGKIQSRLVASLEIIRLAEKFKSSPEQFTDVLIQIAMLKENTRLEITKENGEIIIKIDRNGKLKTIRLPFKGNQKIH
jgi:hypothetical protein